MIATTPYYEPTASEIAQKQTAMDAEMLALHPAWAQRTSAEEAKRALQIEYGAAYRAQRDALALNQIRPQSPSDAPTPAAASNTQWTQKYEVAVNDDKSVSYVRDGEERIRDMGDSIGIAANDKDSIRDAVRLGRERWGDRMHVEIKDEAKRDAVLAEMARQGVRPQAELAERYAEIKSKVEAQREAAKLSAPQAQREKEIEVEYVA